MRVAYTLNGLIGGLSGKNSSRTNEDDMPYIIDYVYSFYGSYDAIYPLHHIVTNQKLSKQIIKMAVNVYENTINFRGSDTFTWGDGDSIDRERVRNILENDFLFKEVKR